MSIKGEGVKKNPQQGLKWLMAAARKRYAPAEAYLGDLYWSGQIVNGDRTRAVMWYILARESAQRCHSAIGAKGAGIEFPLIAGAAGDAEGAQELGLGLGAGKGGIGQRP